MTFEKKLKKVKTSDDNTSLMISPRMIKRGGRPVYDDETLALYSHMDDNTKEFAEQVITKLVSIANYFERDSQIPIQFGLLLCGIKYSIDLSIDHDIDYFNNDDLMTKFIFSYTPEKKEEKDGIQKLKRKKIRNKSWLKSYRKEGI